MPRIQISGDTADFVSGLIVNAGNTIMRGLSIIRFPRAGIFVPAGAGPGNLFEANYVGVASDGTAAPNLAVVSIWNRPTTSSVVRLAHRGT